MDAKIAMQLKDACIEELLCLLQANGYSVHCPCCGENEACLTECSYVEDCPDDAEKMERLRRIMNGRPD